MPKFTDDPQFECPACGYEDYIGNMARCPVCDPPPANPDDDPCQFFTRAERACRQDGKPCPFAASKRWENCEKLAGWSFDRLTVTGG